jgi:hypothetical protein
MDKCVWELIGCMPQKFFFYCGRGPISITDIKQAGVCPCCGKEIEVKGEGE